MIEFEKRLKLLFDAQHFFREPKLDEALEHGPERALNDDELELLFAAGEPFAKKEKKYDD